MGKLVYSVGHHVYAQSAGSDSVVADVVGVADSVVADVVGVADSVVADVVGVADADLSASAAVGYLFVAWRSMSSATSSGRSSGR